MNSRLEDVRVIESEKKEVGFMKKIKKFIFSSFIALAAIVFTGQGSEASAAYSVKEGDSLWKIGLKYGVSVQKLKSVNNKTTDELYVGEELTIPPTISATEKDLLARLVEAEAKGEPYEGKVAVATVVLNRVDSPLYPDTITEVIYQDRQFTPVANGEINKPASEESKRAVNEALAFHGLGQGSLYFYNPKKTDDQWVRTKNTTIVIGDHVFAK